jgi:hypothetical protein
MNNNVMQVVARLLLKEQEVAFSPLTKGILREVCKAGDEHVKEKV